MKKSVIMIAVIALLLVSVGGVYSQTEGTERYVHTLLLDSVQVDPAGFLLTYSRSNFTIGEIYLASRLFSAIEKPQDTKYLSRIYREAGAGPPYLLIYYEDGDFAFVDLVLPSHPQDPAVTALTDPELELKLQAVQTVQFE